MTVMLTQAHSHQWRIAEIDYTETFAVRRYECECGAINFDYVA